MRVHGLDVRVQDDRAIVSYQIESPNFPDRLWFEVTGQCAQALQVDSYNSALCALLIPAAFHGEALELAGPISQRLASNLDDIRTFLSIYDPRYRQVEVSYDGVRTGRRAVTGRVGTGFSAGVDSFATLALYDGIRRPLRVTDLCTFDVGAMGHSELASTQQLYRSYADRTRTFAAAAGYHGTAISSNLDSFYKSPLYYIKTHSFRNAAAALLLEDQLDYYLYSSGLAPEKIGIRRAYSMACMDAVMLPMLSTENMNLISAGAGTTRFEKMQLIADLPQTPNYLDVCVNSASKRLDLKHINCSRCWKCQRTMVSLDILGALPAYGKAFDLDHFARNRRKMYRAVLLNAVEGDSLDREVVEQARAAGHDMKMDVALRGQLAWRKVSTTALRQVKRNAGAVALYRKFVPRDR